LRVALSTAAPDDPAMTDDELERGALTTLRKYFSDAKVDAVMATARASRRAHDIAWHSLQKSRTVGFDCFAASCSA